MPDAKVEPDKIVNSKLPKLTEERKAFLEQDVEMEELAWAIRNSPKGKVCGVDGILIKCYNFFWKDLKRHMFELFIQIEKGSTLPLLATKSIITLLQKTNYPPLKVGSYKPLCLTCTEYKVYLKILVVRLKVVLQEIIHPDQTGFISGRFMGENVNELFSLIDLLL